MYVFFFKKKKGRQNITLIIAGSKHNGSSLVPNEALGDSRLAEVLGQRPTFLQDRIRAEDLDDERVTAGTRLELVNLGEDWLPQSRLRIALLRWCRRRRRRRRRLLRRRRHGLSNRRMENPNPKKKKKKAKIHSPRNHQKLLWK